MKILVTSLFSFPYNVLKSYIVIVVKFHDCMGKGLDLRQSLNMYREPTIELSQVTFRWCNLLQKEILLCYFPFLRCLSLFDGK